MSIKVVATRDVPVFIAPGVIERVTLQGGARVVPPGESTPLLCQPLQDPDERSAPRETDK